MPSAISTDTGIEVPTSVRTPAPFAFSDRRLDDRTSLVAVEGDLDLASTATLKWGLMEVLQAGRDRIVLDLSRVTFIDSTSLATLVSFKRTLSDGGVLVIVAATQRVLKIFEITGLDRSFEIFSTVDAAISRMHQLPVAPREATSEPPSSAAAERQTERGDQEQGQESGSAVPGPLGLCLTGDAALVVGIASTAMPFARSPEARAERWMRALRQHGEAGAILSALGVSDAPATGEATAASIGEQNPDAVEKVTRSAHRIAEERGVPTIHTTDLLAAVIEVYGPAFERLLTHHGVASRDVIEQLGFGQN